MGVFLPLAPYTSTSKVHTTLHTACANIAHFFIANWCSYPLNIYKVVVDFKSFRAASCLLFIPYSLPYIYVIFSLGNLRFLRKYQMLYNGFRVENTKSIYFLYWKQIKSQLLFSFLKRSQKSPLTIMWQFTVPLVLLSEDRLTLYLLHFPLRCDLNAAGS